MTTLSATLARTRLYTLLDEVAKSHEPVQIKGKRHTGVLLAEEDWRAIQETIYLCAVPGLKKSILKGLKTPASKCSRESAR